MNCGYYRIYLASMKVLRNNASTKSLYISNPSFLRYSFSRQAFLRPFFMLKT